MLDWVNFNQYKGSYQKYAVEKLYREIYGEKNGICHVSGHNSLVIIESGNIAIKIYDMQKNNIQHYLNLIEFHEKHKNKFLKNHDHIQKVYEIKKNK
jgi:hypothetical protein